MEAIAFSLSASRAGDDFLNLANDRFEDVRVGLEIWSVSFCNVGNPVEGITARNGRGVYDVVIFSTFYDLSRRVDKS